MSQLAQAMQQMGMGMPPPASYAPSGVTQPTGTVPQGPAPSAPTASSAPFVPAPAAQPEDLKVKYANQLAKMKEMGFINEEVNLDALKATHGIIDAAIERIITMLK